MTSSATFKMALIDQSYMTLMQGGDHLISIINWCNVINMYLCYYEKIYHDLSSFYGANLEKFRKPKVKDDSVPRNGQGLCWILLPRFCWKSYRYFAACQCLYVSFFIWNIIFLSSGTMMMCIYSQIWSDLILWIKHSY